MTLCVILLPTSLVLDLVPSRGARQRYLSEKGRGQCCRRARADKVVDIWIATAKRVSRVQSASSTPANELRRMLLEHVQGMQTQPAIDIRHEGRTLFVPGGHECDLRAVGERLHELQVFFTGNAKI